MWLSSLLRHHWLQNPSPYGPTPASSGSLLFLCLPSVSPLTARIIQTPCHCLFTCPCPPPETHRAGSLRLSCHFIPNSPPESVAFSSSSINVYGPLIKLSSTEIPAPFFWQEKVNPHPTDLNTQQLLLPLGLQNDVRRRRLSCG